MKNSADNSVKICPMQAPEPGSGPSGTLADRVSAAANPRPADLAPGEPDVFDLVNPEGRTPLLLVADHAGRHVPAALDRLGLPAAEFDRHIAYDPGVDAVTRMLARRLDAPAIIHRYSRLLIDPNRPVNDPTPICQISDGTIVPGNRGLSIGHRAERAAMYFHPYHDAVSAALGFMRERGPEPAVVSVHSFSPVVRGRPRPWDIGVLWAEDGRMPLPFMEKMRAQGLCVGDNEPYSGRNLHGYTMEMHVLSQGLANILLELRQDLVADETGQALWAERIEMALRPILGDLGKMPPSDAHLTAGEDDEPRYR